MRITIADDPHTDYLIAEVWSDDQHVADISRRGDGVSLIIEVYSNPNEKAWVLGLDELMECCKRAKDLL
jgi:hypothetical protein